MGALVTILPLLGVYNLIPKDARQLVVRELMRCWSPRRRQVVPARVNLRLNRLPILFFLSHKLSVKHGFWSQVRSSIDYFSFQSPEIHSKDVVGSNGKRPPPKQNMHDVELGRKNEIARWRGWVGALSKYICDATAFVSLSLVLCSLTEHSLTARPMTSCASNVVLLAKGLLTQQFYLTTRYIPIPLREGSCWVSSRYMVHHCLRR